MRIQLWTDGSGLATGGPGGWAFVLQAIDQHGEVVAERERSGGIPDADCTNQRAELTAVIEGLVALDRPTTLTVLSDSEYVIHGFTKGWVARWRENGWLNREGEPVANRDLWTMLAQGVDAHDVSWWHVKGHAKTYACPSCSWTGDEPRRATPKARIRWCPACFAAGSDVRVEARDKYPLNVRCDELAGAERRKLLPAVAA